LTESKNIEFFFKDALKKEKMKFINLVIGTNFELLSFFNFLIFWKAFFFRLDFF